MGDKYAIGIDLGATNFRIGVVSSDGVVHERYMEEVGPEREAEDIAHLLFLHIKRLLETWPDVSGVGIGIPGIVDREAGVVHQSPHYPAWSEVKFKELLSEAFEENLVIDNDANMIALGEGLVGAARGLKNFLTITLGTGVGGAIFCDGKIVHGDKGFAGEIGHMIIDFHGPKCSCGSFGCWEMFVSATGLRQLVESAPDETAKETFLKGIGGEFDKVTPLLLYNQAKEGDIFASVTWKKFGSYLGAGIASLVHTLGIMNIVIGGGVSNAWDFFINSAEKEIERRSYKTTAKMIKLHQTELGNDAGIIGAAQATFKT